MWLEQGLEFDIGLILLKSDIRPPQWFCTHFNLGECYGDGKSDEDGDDADNCKLAIGSTASSSIKVLPFCYNSNKALTHGRWYIVIWYIVACCTLLYDTFWYIVQCCALLYTLVHLAYFHGADFHRVYYGILLSNIFWYTWHTLVRNTNRANPKP